MLLESLDQIADHVLTQGSLAQERAKSSLDSALIHPGEIERDERRVELPRPALIGGQKPALPFLGPSKALRQASPRDLQGDRAHARVDRPGFCPIAIARSILAAIVLGGSNRRVGLRMKHHLDEFLELSLDPPRQEILAENRWKVGNQHRRLAHGHILKTWPLITAGCETFTCFAGGYAFTSNLHSFQDTTTDFVSTRSQLLVITHSKRVKIASRPA